MYKSVLKDYTGEVSTVYKQLSDGNELRNALVHEPNIAASSKGATKKYLLEINLAIMHLQYLCYPKSDAMAYLYEHAKSR